MSTLREALERKSATLAPHTDAFRWSDEDLPGLVIDLFADVAVINAYRVIAPAELHDVATQLTEVRALRAVYVKHRPKEARTVSASAEEAAPVVPVLGAAVDAVVAHEAGVAFSIRPANGIAVGLYVDSSQARAWVRANAAGRRVLNLFSYTCGFGLNASLGGATRAVNVDASRRVLDWGEHNALLNGLTVDRHDYIAGDAFDWLRRFAKKGEQFDLVITDPPGFATTRSSRFSAVNDYHRLVEAAAAVLSPSGSLLAICNVENLTTGAFDSHLRRGAPALRISHSFSEGAVKSSVLTR